MERNNLKMIVRSHECVSNGFDLPFSGSMRHALCTVFSASNYGGGGNLGAYMVFTNCGVMPHATQVTNTLYYSVHQYDMSAMNASSDLSLHGMMLRKQVELAEAFKAADSSCTGILSRTKWAEVMQRTVGVKINWHLLVTLVVSKEAMTPEGDILYMVFLNTFESNAAKAANSDRVSVDGTGLKEGNEDEINYFLIESLYAQAEKLEEVFNFFDQNQDGSVDEVELRIGYFSRAVRKIRRLRLHNSMSFN